MTGPTPIPSDSADGDLELMVLIPGLDRLARHQHKKQFVEGVELASEARDVSTENQTDAPVGALRMRVRDGGTERVIDVFEAYWHDLVPSLTQAHTAVRVQRGLSLLAYWFVSGIWKGILRRKYLTISVLLSAVALVVWYLGILALFLDAVRDDPQTQAELVGAVSWFQRALGSLEGWKIWLFASLFMGVVPVTMLVDLMDFSKRFLAEEPGRRAGPPLRFEIHGRVKEQVRAALAAGPYRRLTVVGHSFGSVVAADLMADLTLPEGLPVRLVTLGSPIELLARKATWLADEVRRCCERPDLEEWLAIESRADWFSSGVGFPEGLEKCRTVEVRPQGTFLDRVTARTHARYFDHQQVVDLILEGGP